MPYIKKEYRGVHFNRAQREPMEKQFAEAWQRHCEVSRDPATASGDMLRQLLNPSDGDLHHPLPISDRDRVVAATVVQWLGSPVGQGFLKDALDGKRPSDGKVVFGRRAGRGR